MNSYPPTPAPRRSLPELLGVMAIVAAVFFLGIKLGFVLHRDPQPDAIASVPLTALAILVLLAAAVWLTPAGVRSLSRAARRRQIRAEVRAMSVARAAERRRRVAELAADPDPVRAKYALLVERGEDWPDEKIAYAEDRTRTATCAHLQPIERAMRNAGIEMRLFRQGTVIARCRVDHLRLQQDFGLTPPARYAEYYESDRGADDIPRALLVCDDHHSTIILLHPAEPGAKAAPIFPQDTPAAG